MVLFLGKGTPELMLVASAIVFFVPVTMVLNSIFSGLKLFGKILKLTVVEKVLDVVLLVFFIFVVGADIFSILYVKIVVSFIITAIYLYYFKKLKETPLQYERNEVKSFFKTSVLANVFAGFMRQSQTWVLIAFLAPHVLGLMYLLQRFENYFFNLPSSALLQVAQPFLSSESKNKKKLMSYTNLIFKFQLITNIIFILIFLAIVPFVVTFFFPKYVEIIPVLPLAVIGFLFVFPFGGLIKSINRNDIILYSAIIAIAVIFAFGIPLIMDYGLVGAVLLYFFLKSINSIFLYFFLRKIGYKISFIPRKDDIQLFYSAIKKLILMLIKKFNPFGRK
ncbi:MAG: oligosaccharide flippase family protein [Candidatus Diapherotrites archaeon]|uniref:Oligosaccharide flippase family protein n=1 Tax=Candidatus Iainarchaeum sp. TaxID=3101447 RepID=A0A8T5GF20_9ARCH|nr:oligosaccharide flippase family protein [Candidatus Diapherotrites archaeon]